MKQRSIGSGGLCSYLTDDGNKCAVGALIPDGHPAQLNKAGVQELLKVYPELEIRINSLMGCVFQHFHDNSMNWNKTGGVSKRELKKFINDHKHLWENT